MICTNCRGSFQKEGLRGLLVFKGDDRFSGIYTVCPNCSQKEDSSFKEGWYALNFLFLKQKKD